jgi:predicted DsbA family dithiol-disulfide isomerase
VVHRSYELNPQVENGTVPITEAAGYRIGGRVFGDTFDVHRLIHFANARGLQGPLMDLAFRVNFAAERAVHDRQTLLNMAVEAGLDALEARKVLDDPDAYAEEVRADEQLGAELGAGGVSFLVLNRPYGVSGVQSAEMFTQALEQAWADRPAA